MIYVQIFGKNVDISPFYCSS